MIERFPPLLLLLLQLLLVTTVVLGAPLLTVVQDESNDVSGQTENCKSVSIPATTACAPGLVCNPNTGTCVPDAYHLKKYYLDKTFDTSKVPFLSSNHLGKSSSDLDDKVPNLAWL